jgi:hypothetical protein
MTAEVERGLAVLTELAQRSKSSMSRAATDLASNNLSAVEESQNQALEPLHEIYRLVAPFEHILRKAIEVEEELIPRTESAAELPADDAQRKFELADLPREQGRVAGWAEVLSEKARHASEQIKAQPAIAGPSPPPNAPGGPDPAAQRAALLAAYGKAIELAPRARSAAQDAADGLTRQAFSEARLDQEEALKILKEIADQLPKQNQDQQDQKKEPKDQQKEDQKNQEKDEQQQDSQQKPTSGKQPQDQHKIDVSRQQAEALLRQARERERDYRQHQKKYQAIIGGVKVDKDW